MEVGCCTGGTESKLVVKSRDWWIKVQRGWAKFWGWFRENFIILAGALLFVWLIIVWVGFSRGLWDVETLKAYAMYGTAMGTGLLAVATVFMIKKNSQLTELTRLSLEKPVVGEIIIYTIEPVENRIEQDAETMEAEGIYLYDIPLPHIRTDMLPRTLYDIRTLVLGDIFVRYPHYMELIRRYPYLENYLADYAKCISKAQLLIEQTLEDIQACLKEGRLTKAVNAFPSNSKIPLKYLPFWELLSASERAVPRPDYDRYHLWSSDVDSFWQNYKEAIMATIHSTSIPTLIVDTDKALKECEDILARKAERLNKVKEELKAKYLFTEGELQSLRERYGRETGKARIF
ncbi:hypothetical protein ES703_77202 [subsurface metagenome]